MLILVFGLLNTPLGYSQPDLNGTLKRNNFTSPKWIAGYNNINFTGNSIILDQVTGSVYEDLTTYTEVEESNDYITVYNSTHLRAKSDLQYGRYLYYDYGPDYLENFTWTFAFKWVTIGNTGLNDHFYILMSNGTLGDWTDINNNGDDFVHVLINDSPTQQKRYNLRVRDNGAGYGTGWVVDGRINDDWTYWKIIKDGKDIKILWYDNPDFTNLFASYNVTTPTSLKFRYLYPINSQDLNLYPGFYLDGWVKNVDLGTVSTDYVPTGSYYSSDLLINETDKEIYSVYLNGTNPSDTGLDIKISDDNATWIDIPGASGTYGDVLEEYDLNSCYLWFRLNSTTGDNTPSVEYYQVFYASEGGAGSINYRYGIAVLLFILGALIGTGIRRE